VPKARTFFIALNRPDRGWFISPLKKNPAWTIGLAFPFALLATILIFMDQQITAVIVNRRENKLTKGNIRDHNIISSIIKKTRMLTNFQVPTLYNDKKRIKKSFRGSKVLTLLKTAS